MKSIENFKYISIGLLLFISGFYIQTSTASEKLTFTSVEGAYTQQISEAVLKVAYSNLGIEFETLWLPPKRALLMSSTGKSDGEISRLSTVAKNYPQLIQVKIPVNYIEGMAFSKNKYLDIKSWESLRPYKIGVNRGVLFSEKGTKGMDVEFVNSFSALFQMLNKNRVDVIVSPRTIGLVQIYKQNLKGIIINEPPLIEFKLYHYLNKRHSKLAMRLESVLKKMEENGEIKQIQNKYIEDLKKGIVQKVN